MKKHKYQEYLVRCVSDGKDHALSIIKNFDNPTIDDLLFIKRCIDAQIENLGNPGFNEVFENFNRIEKVENQKAQKLRNLKYQQQLKYGFLINPDYENSDCFWVNQFEESGKISLSVSKDKIEKRLVSFSQPARTKGVYLINDFYIGRSANIRNRFYSHLSDAINSRHFNRDLEKALLQKLKNKSPIKVSILSNDPDREDELICKYLSAGFPLLNKRILTPTNNKV